MTTSGDTPKISIQQNTNFIDVLKNETEQDVLSQDPQSSESSNLNYPVEVPNSLKISRPVYGGPSEAKQTAKEALGEISKLLSPEISEESLQIIDSFIDKANRGSGGALPMICEGTACPFLHVCPLHSAKIKLPIGLKCPVETTLVSLWVNKHLKALGIENIDEPEYSFDMDMLYELAAQELVRYRCSAHMSKDPSIVKERQIGESFNGTPFFADVINPVLDAMEKAGRNISKIRDSLLATRKAQVNAGQIILDNTEKAASLRQQAQKLAKARQSKEVMKDADFEIKSSNNE